MPLASATIGALIAGGAALAGSAVSAASAKRNARRARNVERENIRQMNEYNNPRNTLSRLAEAGISPVGQDFASAQTQPADSSGYAQMLGNESQALGQMSNAPTSAVNALNQIATSKNTEENTRFLRRTFQDRCALNHWQAKEMCSQVEAWQYRIQSLIDAHNESLNNQAIQIEEKSRLGKVNSILGLDAYKSDVEHELYKAIANNDTNNPLHIGKLIATRIKTEYQGYANALMALTLENALTGVNLDNLPMLKSTLEEQISTLKLKASFDKQAQQFANDNQFWRQYNDLVNDVLDGWTSTIGNVAGMVTKGKALSLAKNQFDWKRNIEGKSRHEYMEYFDSEGAMSKVSHKQSYIR